MDHMTHAIVICLEQDGKTYNMVNTVADPAVSFLFVDGPDNVWRFVDSLNTGDVDVRVSHPSH